ncbi:MAG TPA: hypothetical protein VHC47_06975 [Mucilaginibacter sp.]|nr:hypothetical protein [Mucilaginibacter sp.]
MSIKKCGSAFIMILGLLFAAKNSFGQQAAVDSTNNKPKRVTFAEFHLRVERATKLLQAKELSGIADSDHVNIMMCLNTIFLNNFDKRFNDVKCKKLVAISNERDYKHNITKVYPEWLYNRGMGQYYPKLKMELYGTPSPYATFAVSK